jgi:hypothetical protein
MPPRKKATKDQAGAAGLSDDLPVPVDPAAPKMKSKPRGRRATTKAAAAPPPATCADAPPTLALPVDDPRTAEVPTPPLAPVPTTLSPHPLSPPLKRPIPQKAPAPRQSPKCRSGPLAPQPEPQSDPEENFDINVSLSDDSERLSPGSGRKCRQPSPVPQASRPNRERPAVPSRPTAPTVLPVAAEPRQGPRSQPIIPSQPDPPEAASRTNTGVTGSTMRDGGDADGSSYTGSRLDSCEEEDGPDKRSKQQALDIKHFFKKAPDGKYMCKKCS